MASNSGGFKATLRSLQKQTNSRLRILLIVRTARVRCAVICEHVFRSKTLVTRLDDKLRNEGGTSYRRLPQHDALLARRATVTRTTAA